MEFSLADSGSYWEEWSKDQILSETLFQNMLHNILRTHKSRPELVSTPADDKAARQNDLCMCLYVPDENYRNPSREAEHQGILLYSIQSMRQGTTHNNVFITSTQPFFQMSHIKS